MGERQFLKPGRILAYLFAFAFPPLVVAVMLTLKQLGELMIHAEPEALSAETAALPPPPPLDPKLPVAAILMSAKATEITDLLGPYEILAESGLVQVVTVAPERKLLATTGPLAVIPDYSFKDAPEIDLLVVPAVTDFEDPAYSAWLARVAPRARLVLGVCEGTRLLARAGLLDGLAATSHFVAIEELRIAFKKVRMIEGVRYVSDGKFITSAGVTAGLDAALHAVERFAAAGLGAQVDPLGRKAASTTASRLGYRWNREARPFATPGTSPAGTGAALEPMDFARLFVHAGFDWTGYDIAVLAYPGVSEIALAAALEAIPRSLGARAVSLAARREPLRTRHGLTVVPALGAANAPPMDLLIVPSGGSGLSEARSPTDDPEIDRWVKTRGRAVKSFFHKAPGEAFDDVLRLLSTIEGDAMTAHVAKMIEYPLRGDLAPKLQARGIDFSGGLWLPPLLIGLLGLAFAWTVDRRLDSRRTKR